MGVVAGDALGVPYEFHTREKIRSNPATTMRGYGTYNAGDDGLVLTGSDAAQEMVDWY